mgnify:CR=1 FL=1
MTSRTPTIVALLIAMLVIAGTAAAQGGFDLSWYSVDGGGGTFSTGGSYSLGGTNGQYDAGSLSGGSYTLLGGFWGAATVTTPGYGSSPVAGSTINVGTTTTSTAITTTTTISETGTAALNVTGMTITGTNSADFSITSATSFTIAEGGANQTTTIQCLSATAGSKVATLSIAHNATGSPATYTLNCTVNAAPVGGGSSTSSDSNGSGTLPSSQTNITLNGVAVGASGGTFNLSPWQLIIPANLLANGSTLTLNFFFGSVPNAPNGLRLFARVMNAQIFNSAGTEIKSFTPPLQICFTYTDADLQSVGGDAKNFVILTSSDGKTWEELVTTVDTANKKVCASVTHFSLFELAARIPTKIPATGDGNAPMWLLAIALFAGAGWGWLVMRRKMI